MKEWIISQWRTYKSLLAYLYLSMATWAFLFGSIFIFIGLIPTLNGLSMSPSWLKVVGEVIIRIVFVLVISITAIIIKIKALKIIAGCKELR